MDEPISRSKQLRGRLVVGIRHGLTKPSSRRLPLSLLRRYHRLRRRVAPARYSDADPHSVCWVDPTLITQSLIEQAPPYPQWGRVVDGSWDHESEPFADRLVVQAIRQHFQHGTPWKETTLVEAYVDQLERFGNAWEYTSWADFGTRCAEIEALYESLSEHGYEPAGQRDPDISESVASLIAEINVDIGRNGEFYWRGYGQHRLAIAQLLDIASVPVVVNRRHRQWQAVRDRIRETKQSSIDSAFHAHPDLQDIVNSRGHSAETLY